MVLNNDLYDEKHCVGRDIEVCKMVDSRSAHGSCGNFIFFASIIVDVKCSVVVWCGASVSVHGSPSSLDMTNRRRRNHSKITCT